MDEARGIRDGGPLVKGPGLSAGALKLLAVAAMLVDHLAIVFVPDYYSPLGSFLHFIGRITGPMMFYFIAEGYHRTRDLNRYTLRLFLFAVISYIPFIYFITGALPTAASWNKLNVIYTLLLGHLALRALHEIPQKALSIGAVALCLLLARWGDFGYFGVMAILLFGLLRGSFRDQCLGYGLFTFAARILPPLLRAFSLLQAGEDPGRQFAQAFVSCGLLLPLLLLGLYNGEKGRVNKWLFYVFYPAHLLVLGLIKKVALLFS